MENSLILCGGTGAHVGAAFLRLHTLAYALGFLDRREVDGAPRAFPFPRIFLVDQDDGDAQGPKPSAWRLVQTLLAKHPGLADCPRAFDRPGPPESYVITPLPVGREHDWYRPPMDRLARRFSASPLLPALASARQREIEYSKGMMGSPALGAMLFRLKAHDSTPEGGNHDGRFDELLRREGPAVVVGSAVGGTGAAVAPVLARRLAENPANKVMAVMLVRWFEFLDSGDEELRERARRRNRVMRENAHSALEFYGRQFTAEVAAVPVGMPTRAFKRREFTSDVGQPVFENYIHAAAALCGYRHFLHPRPFDPGLYVMGAVDPTRLDGGTAIPGGTLQGLANQAVSVVHLLKVWRDALLRDQDRRVQPVLYRLVAETGITPERVGEELGGVIAHYEEQVAWLRDVLEVTGTVNPSYALEAESREHWRPTRRGLAVEPGAPVEAVVAAVFHWACHWVGKTATTENGLQVPAALQLGGSHWPELVKEGIEVAPDKNGDLTQVPAARVATVMDGFVDGELVSTNGWPHPVAAADYFRYALEHGRKVAWRQLELLLLGVVAGVLKVRRLGWSEAVPVSLERLVSEEQRAGSEGLAVLGVFYPRRKMLIGFNSPHTLLCPIPFINEAAYQEIWQELWTLLAEPPDAQPWQEAPAPATWGNRGRHISQIRAWLADLKRLYPTATVPTWTEVFQDHPEADEDEPFGVGAPVMVWWGGPGMPDRRLLDVELPAAEVGEWEPPKDMPTAPPEHAFAQVEGLRQFRDAGGSAVFSAVEFERPGDDERTLGFWEEHLEHLRRAGRIRRFGVRKNGDVWLITRGGGGLVATFFPDSVLLRRSTILTESVLPLFQDPVPGSSVPAGQLRLPDLPLRADFVDLAEMPAEPREPVLERARRGDDLRSERWAPRLGMDRGGRRLAVWELRLRGRRDPLVVELPLEEPAAEAEAASQRAHWLVWPRFRSRNPGLWRAYYLFDHCESRHLAFDTLWLEGTATEADGTWSARLRRLKSPLEEPGPYALAYRAGQGGAHCGGPPVALALRQRRGETEHGLYWVHLDVLGDNQLTVDLGIDFGTSHTVAACRVEGEAEPSPLEFAPELAAQPARERGLSLHVSENAARALQADDAILALGTWLPTYRRSQLADARGVLPSELLLRRPIAESKGTDLPHWAPCRDFFIPPLDLVRNRLAEWLVADFKWNSSAAGFLGHEGELRDHYLGLVLDLAMAEIVAHRLGGLPKGGVRLTLTYPLRSSRAQVLAYEHSLAYLTERGQRSYGVPFSLAQQVGLYDESRAAQVTTNVVGEVIAVADLGGGTLDLFISACPIDRTRFREVADSARLGGNLLLHRVAKHADFYLPNVSGWRQRSPEEVAARLRTWMRTKGWPSLFSDGGGRITLPELELGSFSSIAEGRRIQQLLDRYFHLICDFLARNLAAYLAEEWYPKAPLGFHDKLRISLQLRGNGWRLSHQHATYEAIAAAVNEEVRQRLAALWPRTPGGAWPDPSRPSCWAPVGRYRGANPKAEPIRRATGRGMQPEEVQSAWHTYSLVDLDVIRPGAREERVRWTSPVPFPTGGPESKVEIRSLAPPISLSRPGDERAVELTQLEAPLQGKVNEHLQTEREDLPEGYRAPIAAVVWEAAFQSEDVWPDGAAR